jgi:hypothetical protein
MAKDRSNRSLLHRELTRRQYDKGHSEEPMDSRTQLEIPYPPQDIYAENLTPVTQVTRERNDVFELDHIEYPPEGGIYVYHKGTLHPTKGFPTPESVGSNNIAKRLFIGQMKFFANKNTLVAFFGFLFLPWKRKMRVVEAWIEGFNKLSGIVIRPYCMKPEYYSNSCRQIRIFVEKFCTFLGIRQSLANGFGQRVAHMIEFDNAYRYRIQDLLSETSAEKLAENPRREISRLINFLNVREPKNNIKGKFLAVAELASIIFWHPRVKKALRKALECVDFSQMQMDEADRYHCLRFGNYEFGGIPLWIREQTYLRLHNGKPPMSYAVQNIQT